jgi:hypothetical protein
VSEFRIAYQDEDDQILEAIHAARKTLDGDELRVTEQLVRQALEQRCVTRVGDLLKELEQVGPTGRRQLVDEARTSLGMKTLDAEEAAEAFKRNRATMPPSDGPRFQVCAAENCNVYPLSELGVPIEVADRVWWCARHKDQAGPEDHLPPEPKYVLDFATMSPKAVGAERERLLEADRELVRKAAELEQRRREGAKALAEVRDRYADQAKPINIGGWLVDGKGRIVDDR